MKLLVIICVFFLSMPSFANETSRTFAKKCEGAKIACDSSNGFCTIYNFTNTSSEVSVKINYFGPADDVELCKKNYKLPRQDTPFTARFFNDKGNTISDFEGRHGSYGALQGKMNFSDGEIWDMYITHEGAWNYVTQNAIKIRENNITSKIIEERNRRQNENENIRIANFRSRVQPGDQSSSGMVLEVNKNMVKIQIEQCIQREYNGNCLQQGNAEKWFRKSEIFPAR